MAKGQKRSTKEPKKQKSADKKPDGPKYLRPADIFASNKQNPSKGGKKS